MSYAERTASVVRVAPAGLPAAAASIPARGRVEVVHRLEQPDRSALQGVLGA